MLGDASNGSVSLVQLSPPSLVAYATLPCPSQLVVINPVVGLANENPSLAPSIEIPPASGCCASTRTISIQVAPPSFVVRMATLSLTWPQATEPFDPRPNMSHPSFTLTK